MVACPIVQRPPQATKLLAAYKEVDDDAIVANLHGGYRAWDGELECF